MTSTAWVALLLGGGLGCLAASAGCEVGGGSSCPSATDLEDVGLLQMHKAEHAVRSPTATDGYPINFDRFVGGVCDGLGCLRIEVPAVVEGVTYNFLMDTGSSTLALCDMPDTPLEAVGDSEGQVGGCAVYGSVTCGDNGFVGDVYTASLTVGSMEPVEGGDINDGNVVVVMAQKRGEKGNACGKPESGSVGAVQLDGIFGFGFYNGAFCSSRPGGYTNVWSAEVMSQSGCMNCPAGCGKKAAAPWQLLLGGQKPLRRQWGISWAGAMGPGSGSLFAGDAAAAMFEPYMSKSTTSKFKLDTGRGYYGLSIKQYRLTFPNGTSSAPVPCTGDEQVFDTGTSAVSFPPDIVKSALVYFQTTSVPVVLNIDAEPADGFPAEPMALELIPDEALEYEKRGNIQTSDSGMLGLAIMVWYESVFIDYDAGLIAFGKRAAPLKPLPLQQEAQ